MLHFRSLVSQNLQMTNTWVTPRAMLWAAAGGAVLFMVVFLLDGATRPGYDPLRHPVSALALGGRGWIQVANFAVTGLCMLVGAIGLRRTLRAGPGAQWLPVLMAVFGLSLIASGVFVMDPMAGYPPGALGEYDSPTSWHGELHGWAGLVVFSSLPALALVAARRFRTEPRGGAWVWYSMASAIVTAFLFVTFSVAWETGDDHAGLLQRASILVGWSWLALFARHTATATSTSGVGA